ncbi:MAG: cation transporter [Candidatus Methanomethylophilaceae archaeon]|nr:hypothetical protein [Thermoplasmata archaeon]MBR4216191.1 cation transporter [Candidatus Methanomethylophilaceae archaeon]
MINHHLHHLAMKIVLYMNDLDCQECADKIEAHIQRYPGVKGACLMLVTRRFIIDCEDSKVDEIVEEVKKSAAKAQGNVTVSRIQ